MMSLEELLMILKSRNKKQPATTKYIGIKITDEGLYVLLGKHSESDNKTFYIIKDLKEFLNTYLTITKEK